MEYYLMTDEGYNKLSFIIFVLTFATSFLTAVYFHWHRREKLRNNFLSLCFASPFIAVFLPVTAVFIATAFVVLVLPYYLFTKLIPQKPNH